jgi:hypothetical protein
MHLGGLRVWCKRTVKIQTYENVCLLAICELDYAVALIFTLQREIKKNTTNNQ